jgi:TonB-linked SusC/RagA family outer membrane protein
LKDAASAALYGARGANGVVLITTKRGRTPKPVINFKATFGVITRGLPEYDRVNQKEYYELWWTALRNRYVTEGYSKADAGLKASGLMDGGLGSVVATLGGYNSYNVPNDQLLNPVTGQLNPNAKLLWDDNWQDELTKTGYRQEYTFSGSKGDQNNSFYASISYLDETGIVPATGFNRITARVNATNHFAKWLKTNISLGASHQETDNVESDGSNAINNPFEFTRNIAPIYPVYQHDPVTGKILRHDNGSPVYDFGSNKYGMQPGVTGRKYSPNYNLVATLPLDYAGAQREALTSRLDLEGKIWDGLTANISGAFDVSNSYGISYSNDKYGEYADEGGMLERYNGKRTTWDFKEYLQYAKTFNGHSVSVEAGHESYSYNYQYLSAARKGFPFTTWELALGADMVGMDSYHDDYRLEGYFGLANYDYKGKYFVGATYRREASSRFSSESRWGNFWSVSGAWNIASENFMKNITALDRLKLRVSYGAQGNDGTTSLYPYMGLFSMEYKNGNYNGAFHTSVNNDELKWESQGMFNVGVDFILFKKFSGTVEYYNRSNVDMIYSQQLARSNGISSMPKNIGNMVSNGVELLLNYEIFNSKDFKWSIGLNLTHWKDKITKMSPADSLGLSNGIHRTMEGHSYYEYFIKEFAGVDEHGNALYYGDGNTADQNNFTGDKSKKYNTYTQADYYFTGKSSIPDFYGGFNTYLYYKGFDLSVILSYSVGGYVYDYDYESLMGGGSPIGQAWHKDMLKSWEEGDPSDIPILDNSSSSLASNYQRSSRFLISASYLNLKNVTLGYTLPLNALKKMRMTNFRVYVSLDNFYLLSARKGLDPQVGLEGERIDPVTGGHGYATFYPTKTCTVGLQVQF